MEIYSQIRFFLNQEFREYGPQHNKPSFFFLLEGPSKKLSWQSSWFFLFCFVLYFFQLKCCSCKYIKIFISNFIFTMMLKMSVTNAGQKKNIKLFFMVEMWFLTTRSHQLHWLSLNSEKAKSAVSRVFTLYKPAS